MLMDVNVVEQQAAPNVSFHDYSIFCAVFLVLHRLAST